MKNISLIDIKEESGSHNPKIMKKTMIRNGELPHLTNFSQAYFPPGEVVKKHVHPDMSEVFFIESGTGIIEVNDEEIKVEPGSCIAVEAGESHAVINTGSVVLIMTYFGVTT